MARVKNQSPRERDTLRAASAEEVGRGTEGRWFSVAYITLRAPGNVGFRRHLSFTYSRVVPLSAHAAVCRKEKRTVLTVKGTCSIQVPEMGLDHYLCVCPEIRRTSAGGETVNARTRMMCSNQINNDKKNP